jgi:hypothetical protein
MQYEYMVRFAIPTAKAHELSAMVELSLKSLCRPAVAIGVVLCF